MFIITKTFTDDEGHLFTKVNPKQYSTPGEAYDATLKPVWFLEKELDNHGIPTGRTRKACSCLLCDACGHKETVDDTFDEPYK